MALVATHLLVRWEGVSGAEGYEITIDGVKVATTGPRARTSKVLVSQATNIEVRDLPRRSLIQEVRLTQTVGA